MLQPTTIIGRPLRQARPHRHSDRCNRRSRGQAAALRFERPSSAFRAGDHNRGEKYRA